MQIVQRRLSGNIRLCAENSGTKEAAGDIYHEAFLATWRNVQLKRFTPANENEWNAYLNRVARNKWIDQLREKKEKKPQRSLTT